jgi:serine/threonine protein phosphatase PrpC
LRAIGKYPLLEPARYEVALGPGDWLVAGCPGLSAHVEDAAIREAVGRAGLSPAALARHLAELANRGGDDDDCTVVAVSCP